MEDGDPVTLLLPKGTRVGLLNCKPMYTFVACREGVWSVELARERERERGWRRDTVYVLIEVVR
jgi:hypothetical protein